jgi:hypothetical protein
MEIIMWIKYFLLFSLALSCNVMEMTGIAETDLGNNFGRDLKPGLMHFYKFDEAGTGVNRIDSIAGANFIDTTAEQIPSTSGKRGGAVDCYSGLTSGSGFLSVTQSITFTVNQSFNISAWVELPANPSGGCADSRGIFTASNLEIFLDDLDCANSGDLRVRYFSVDYNLNDVYNFPGWHHFSFNFLNGGTSIDIYINGNYISTLAATQNAWGTTYFEACSGGAGVSGLGGKLDSLGIWDRELSGEDIRALYNGNNNVD